MVASQTLAMLAGGSPPPFRLILLAGLIANAGTRPVAIIAARQCRALSGERWVTATSRAGESSA